MKKYCPCCGFNITGFQDTEYGVVCPNCHNDFWMSEALPENYRKLGMVTINEAFNNKWR